MRASRLIVGSCLLLGVLAPQAVFAQGRSPEDIEAARVHYRLGVQLYGERKYEEALVELERASALAPTYRLFYDIALVQRQLGDAAGALRSFGAYLDAGADVTAPRRAEVLRAIADLTLKVATVTITSNVAGVEISDNEHVLGKTPLAGPLLLNPGSHRLSASKEGYLSATRSVDVSAGDRVEVPFSLEEASRLPSAPEVTPPTVTSPAPPLPETVPPPGVPSAAPLPPDGGRPERGRAEGNPPVWIGWAATGILAAGAAGTGIAALVESNTLRSDIADHATPGTTIHSAHSTTTTLALVSDVLTASAIVAAGITFYVKVTAKPHAGPPPVRAEVRAGLGAVSFSATF